mgnify:CR=1 FL=1
MALRLLGVFLLLGNGRKNTSQLISFVDQTVQLFEWNVLCQLGQKLEPKLGFPCLFSAIFDLKEEVLCAPLARCSK